MNRRQKSKEKSQEINTDTDRDTHSPHTNFS